MILYLTQGMTSVALRIKETNRQSQLTDWRQLQLLIQPGERHWNECFMGSPWILTGCWPGHRTDVDIANYRPEFPTICYDAEELDPDGRVVFRFDQRLWCLPPGRYLGSVRTYPQGSSGWMPPFNLTHDLSREALSNKKITIPQEYHTETCYYEPGDCPPPPVMPQCCILARFDIDLGPACHEHIIDQAAVNYAVITCEAE